MPAPDPGTTPSPATGVPTTALEKAKARYRDNGLAWSALHVAARSASKVGQFFEQRARAIERNQGRPGTNTVENNRLVWGQHDWSKGGEEWTASPEWRASTVDTFISPYLREGATVVEIGPGAGRWTETLHARAGQLYLVDITETTLELCRARLGDPADVEYMLSEGATLPGVPTRSVDYLFSYDVFVHIAPTEQRGYLAEIHRVLKPGALAVIHHGGNGGSHEGWRAAMTRELFRQNVELAGMRVIEQVDRWGPDGIFTAPVAGDVVTLFESQP